MPIDDRLRVGLVRNADVPPPPVERHLDRVRVRRRRRFAIRVAAASAAVAVIAAVPWGVIRLSQLEGQGPTAPMPELPGTYSVVVGDRGIAAGVEGTWQVTLLDDGSIALEPPSGFEGTEWLGGSYELTGDTELTTNLFVGAPGCQRGDPSVGVYAFAEAGSDMRFSSRSEDSCPPRAALFGGSWERVQ